MCHTENIHYNCTIKNMDLSHEHIPELRLKQRKLGLREGKMKRDTEIVMATVASVTYALELISMK